MSATLHLITGKGGVGKSTLAAALALHLSQKDDGPVLLLEIQGSGRSLELLGAHGKGFANAALPATTNVWGARVMPREAFKQYFGLLLALGNDNSPFAHVTSGLRTKFVDMVVENRVVSAFVDICPGLEPAVLLGKIHWEATTGKTPESNLPWKHVVVDAPATGHGLMLFKSTAALTQVFGSGTIFKQAASIMNFIRNPQSTRLYVVTTLEELPLRETLDIKNQLHTLQISPYRYVLNRVPLGIHASTPPSSVAPASIDPIWQREIDFERESLAEAQDLLDEFKRSAGETAGFVRLREVPGGIDPKRLADLSHELGSQAL